MKKLISKKILLVLSSILVLGALAACSGEAVDPAEPGLNQDIESPSMNDAPDEGVYEEPVDPSDEPVDSTDDEDTEDDAR